MSIIVSGYHLTMTEASGAEESRTTERAGRAALDGDLSFLLARATARSMAEGNAALAPLGLRARSYAVLALATDAVPPTQREIAEYLRLDPSQVVATVDELEQAALVSRETAPADRRANVIVATDSGREVLRRARVLLDASERVLHAQLSDAERESLTRLLGKTAFDP